jgi:hypothetical protein
MHFVFFPHYLKKAWFWGNPVLKINCVFWFPLQMFSETFPAMFIPTGINFRTTDFCKTLPSNYEFCKNRRNESHSLLKRGKWIFMNGYSHRNPLNIRNVRQYGRRKSHMFLAGVYKIDTCNLVSSTVYFVHILKICKVAAGHDAIREMNKCKLNLMYWLFKRQISTENALFSLTKMK